MKLGLTEGAFSEVLKTCVQWWVIYGFQTPRHLHQARSSQLTPVNHCWFKSRALLALILHRLLDTCRFAVTDRNLSTVLLYVKIFELVVCEENCFTYTQIEKKAVELTLLWHLGPKKGRVSVVCLIFGCIIQACWSGLGWAELYMRYSSNLPWLISLSTANNKIAQQNLRPENR